ncbi:MAG: sugar transferase [Aggregatilineales bacterium]
MVRLRLLIIGLAIWLIVLFNLSRPDFVVGGLDLSLSLSPVVYLIASAAVILILLFPDLGQAHLLALLIPLFIIYGLSRLMLTPINPEAPKHSLYYIITEMLILAGTVYSARLVSLAVSNFENAVENVVAASGELRILPKSEGIEMINVELYRARIFNRSAGFIYINIAAWPELPKERGSSPSLEVAFQRRYMQNKVAHIVETSLHRSDIICWYNNGLLLCLPETTYDFAVSSARRLGTILQANLNKSFMMGVAAFPTNGLIAEDLIAAAMHNQQPYLDQEKTAAANATDYSAEAEYAIGAAASDNKENHGTGSMQPSAAGVSLMHTEKMLKDTGMEGNETFHPIMAAPSQTGTHFSLSLRYGLGVANLSLHPILNLRNFFTDALPIARLESNAPHRASNRPDDPDFWVNRLPYQSQISRSAYRIFKRAFDLSIVILSVPVTFPLGVLIALLTYLDSGKPIFFKQQRTGLGGHRFTMYKFRTMVPNAEEMLRDLAAQGLAQLDASGKLAAPLKLDKDPRISRVGRILRKTSLDELPQLLNVLRGEMSLVGPRPTSWDLGSYSLPQTERLNAKPGITGLWQVYGRGTTDFSGWVKWDVMYFEKMSLSLDVRLLILTVLQVLKRKGAR